MKLNVLEHALMERFAAAAGPVSLRELSDGPPPNWQRTALASLVVLDCLEETSSRAQDQGLLSMRKYRPTAAGRASLKLVPVPA